MDQGVWRLVVGTLALWLTVFTSIPARGQRMVHAAKEAGDSAGPTSQAIADGAQSWEPQKPEFLEIARRLRQSANKHFGVLQAEELRRRSKLSGLPILQKIRVRASLCIELLQLGVSGRIRHSGR